MILKMKPFDSLWTEVKTICKENYGFLPRNNSLFIAETIYNQYIRDNNFKYVECGVYIGTTLLPIYHFCRKLYDNFEIYAIDSFTGFPENVEQHPKDFPERFTELFNEGKINEQHMISAEERCRVLKNNKHLKNKYFSNYEEIFKQRIEGKYEIKVVKTAYCDLPRNFPDADSFLNIVFLDCDLYLSYWECFDYFKDRTKRFILDEYYSLKYPGARIATNEFVDKYETWEFFTKAENDPYFERWGIELTN